VNALTPQEQQLRVVNRLIAVKEARDDLIRYLQLTMPDSDDPDDATKSRYMVTPQARLLCEVMTKVELGKLKRVAVSIGPQMGKSQIISRGAPAWSIGRNPALNQILGSYNQDFANEFGFEVRNLVESQVHAQVFPEFGLLKGGKAKDLLMTTAGGKSAFVGVGGSGTGKPADRFVVDDPYRNAEDANSEVFREQVWRWFNGVVFSRCHDGTAIVIVHTRWHQDDLIGRLCDPTHPERAGRFKGLEKAWTYINLPAVVDDPKLADALGLKLEVPTDPQVVEQFGSKPMSALWPGRKSLPLMAEAKRMDPYTFNSLYMGSPAPEDGDYFRKDQLVEYDRDQLPTNLRKYGASDHAVSAKTRRDFTVIGCVGIDEQDDIWVLPDLVWERMETDRTVEELIQKFRIHQPQLWWMEDEMISKAFGPFLLKRMQEEKVYTTTLDPIRPAKDMRTRARSIQGRMQMRKVHFPKFAPWWPKARGQMLIFDSGANDDFVSFMSLIGQGLTKELKPPTVAAEPTKVSGSIGWMLADTARRATEERKKAVW
jgi:predicted phage terminase large subunit-like protein